jgi:hypothetical protein
MASEAAGTQLAVKVPPTNLNKLRHDGAQLLQRASHHHCLWRHVILVLLLAVAAVLLSISSGTRTFVAFALAYNVAVGEHVDELEVLVRVVLAEGIADYFFFSFWFEGRAGEGGGGEVRNNRQMAEKR